MKYLIWSFEHNAWWCPNSQGYTNDRAQAGRYRFEHAQQICLDANTHGDKNEAMVPELEHGEGRSLHLSKGGPAQV